MTEADALACLSERSEVRRCLQNATVTEIMQAYFNAVYDFRLHSYIFPDGTTRSVMDVFVNMREWLEKAIEVEVPYE